MSELGSWGDRRWVGPVEMGSASSLPRAPGLYALVAFQRSQPCRIPRFLAVDPTGLVYVGKATRLRGRAKSLARSYLEGKREHMAGRDFERIDALRRASGFSSVRSKYDLQLFYSACRSPESAEKAETQLLHSYLAKSGEVPPMNAQGSWVSIRS